jgi:deoxyadenosine/deoxycytidine kinase
MLTEAQQRLSAYEDAQSLLEDCIAHTTSGERVLVEYYLTLDQMIQDRMQAGEPAHAVQLQALIEVQHRIERVGTPHEE